jgi:hypothetical protein
LLFDYILLSEIIARQNHSERVRAPINQVSFGRGIVVSACRPKFRQPTRTPLPAPSTSPCPFTLSPVSGFPSQSLKPRLGSTTSMETATRWHCHSMDGCSTSDGGRSRLSNRTTLWLSLTGSLQVAEQGSFSGEHMPHVAC